jgi:hypothetical protein
MNRADGPSGARARLTMPIIDARRNGPARSIRGSALMAEDQLVERARDLMTGAANAFATVQGVLHLSRDPEGARAAWRRRKSFATFPVHAIEVTITDEMRARLPRKFQIVIPDEADGRIWVRHPWTVRTEGAIGWDQQPWAPVHYRINRDHLQAHQLELGSETGSVQRPRNTLGAAGRTGGTPRPPSLAAVLDPHIARACHGGGASDDRRQGGAGASRPRPVLHQHAQPVLFGWRCCGHVGARR